MVQLYYTNVLTYIQYINTSKLSFQLDKLKLQLDLEVAWMVINECYMIYCSEQTFSLYSGLTVEQYIFPKTVKPVSSYT